jgi:hypothetical protein
VDLPELPELQQKLANFAADPAGSLTELMVFTSTLFFLAENGHNPRVTSLIDAFHYVSTSVSVGYANIYPVTPLGKIIGSVVMLVGPSLAAQLLNGAKTPTAVG